MPSCQAGSTSKTSTIKITQRRRNGAETPEISLKRRNRVGVESRDCQVLSGDVRTRRCPPVAGVGRLQPRVCQGAQLAGLPAARPRAPRGGRHGICAAAPGGASAGRVVVEQRQRHELPHRLQEPTHSGLLRIVLGGGGHVCLV